MAIMTAIGLMSGTSMDGVDAAFIQTDGERIAAFGATMSRPYDEGERSLLRAALVAAASLDERSARTDVLTEAEQMVTQAHAQVVEALMRQQGWRPAHIDVIGFHGQTVLHRPERALTVQIGDGQALSDQLGIPVVFDFRAADVAAGGQGAPLVPVFHQALVGSVPELQGPVAILNVGGVANVTYLDGAAPPIACDTGPGNALLDDFMLEREGAMMDRDGAMALAGRPSEDVLAKLMRHPFFDMAPPKSLDRNAFSRVPVAGLSTADGAATLTAFTARSAAQVVRHLPARPATWVVCGGGARNPALIAALRQETGAAVRRADELGWSGDFIEAQAFAFLAIRSLMGLPLTFPGTTGVGKPLGGGIVAKPKSSPRV